jgi:hypothetical protein
MNENSKHPETVMDRDQEVHIDTEEARAGSTPHIVRYVLIISLFLAIAALSVIWITGASTSEERTSQSLAEAVAETETVQDGTIVPAN